MELLKQFKDEFMKFEKERQELANAEKLFGIAITSYPVLMSMEQELKGLEQIFSIYERQKVMYEQFVASLIALSDMLQGFCNRSGTNMI